jgi:hypothetical protein
MNLLYPMHPALYRASQFFAALRAYLPAWAGGIQGELRPDDLMLIKSFLPSLPQQQLFKRMSPNDQRHALAVARTLQEAGHHQLPLIQAALLHDVGKSIGQPIIHRVLIVLFEAFWPAALEKLANPAHFWQTGEALAPDQIRVIDAYSWWRRPFVVHAYHPIIGAIWAKEAGCDPAAVSLILKHQDILTEDNPPDSPQKKMLAALQWADSLN